MKKFWFVFGLVGLLLSGCYSTPHVEDIRPIRKGAYLIELDKDYQQNPQEAAYAYNSFAMSIGAESYTVQLLAFNENAEKLGLGAYAMQKINRNDLEFITPGNVKTNPNMAQVRHFHLGRTLGLIIPFVAVGGLSALIAAISATE